MEWPQLYCSVSFLCVYPPSTPNHSLLSYSSLGALPLILIREELHPCFSQQKSWHQTFSLEQAKHDGKWKWWQMDRKAAHTFESGSIQLWSCAGVGRALLFLFITECWRNMSMDCFRKIVTGHIEKKKNNNQTLSKSGW